MMDVSVNRERLHQEGFVLVAALVMMALLTLLSLGLYSQGQVDQQASTAVRTSTQGYYYAETAINYMAWAFRNDAELDAYDPPPDPADPSFLSANLGDEKELFHNVYDPSAEVKYFDNAPLAAWNSSSALTSRYIIWPDAQSNPPTMYHISQNLPRYLVLKIASDGTITTSLPSFPHPSSPVVGTDIPNNGAIVWLTAGDKQHDFEISSTANSATNCPGISLTDVCKRQWDSSTSSAGSWGAISSSYGIVAYAIGYVDGRPTQMIRAVIM